MRGRTRWVLSRPGGSADGARVYCFPHSGGSPGEYVRWAARLPGHQVRAVQTPGRGSRMDEEPFTGMEALVDSLVSQVAFEEPFVFFGHSLGALVAYETALALRERGLPEPRALLLSGTAAPHTLRARPSLRGLAGTELVAAIERVYGPVPAELHEDPELRDLLLTGLRADLEIVSGYRYRPRPPLSCPVTVLGGRDDEEPLDDLGAWRAYTTGPFDLRVFPGDHFYFRECPDEFFAFLDGALAQSAARAVLGPGPVAAAHVLP
ncbi:thioesterase II family protein [Streptomyces collinus]|uniref:thioesterase II family protein n=1 Tax=Streptomyces collinus TaxID=42684 RepID=UPI0036774289